MRQAVFYALNRDDITQTIMGPVGARWDAPIPDSFFGHTNEGLPRHEYAPELAKQLLAEAGHSQGLQLRTWISNRSDYNKTIPRSRTWTSRSRRNDESRSCSTVARRGVAEVSYGQG
ncbi:MAG: ABC transporter substrate-binding protein [Candidatus Entotheonellia bacterium]